MNQLPLIIAGINILVKLYDDQRAIFGGAPIEEVLANARKANDSVIAATKDVQ